MNHCDSFDHLTHRVSKKTFTLVLAYAMTIHKSHEDAQYEIRHSSI